MALTTEQLQTLAAHIRASTDPAVVATLAGRNDTEMTALYNAPTAVVVWKKRLELEEITSNGFDWVRVDNLSVGTARIWEWMFGSESKSINPSKPNIRAGIAEVWKGTAADLAVQAVVLGHCKRTATLFESLFVTGAGTTADPAQLGWEGTLSLNDISDALNRY